MRLTARKRDGSTVEVDVPSTYTAVQAACYIASAFDLGPFESPWAVGLRIYGLDPDGNPMVEWMASDKLVTELPSPDVILCVIPPGVIAWN